SLEVEFTFRDFAAKSAIPRRRDRSCNLGCSQPLLTFPMPDDGLPFLALHEVRNVIAFIRRLCVIGEPKFFERCSKPRTHREREMPATIARIVRPGRYSVERDLAWRQPNPGVLRDSTSKAPILNVREIALRVSR